MSKEKKSNYVGDILMSALPIILLIGIIMQNEYDNEKQFNE